MNIRIIFNMLMVACPLPCAANLIYVVKAGPLVLYQVPVALRASRQITNPKQHLVKRKYTIPKEAQDNAKLEKELRTKYRVRKNDLLDNSSKYNIGYLLIGTQALNFDPEIKELQKKLVNLKSDFKQK